MRVLVVDDHPVIHEVMRAVVTRAIHPVTIFTELTLQRALVCARSKIDLVILDLGLPGFVRIEALTIFRNLCPSIPVIVFSGLDDANIIRSVLDAGAKGYIPKTSTTETMISALRLVASGGTYIPAEALRQESIEVKAGFQKRTDGDLTGRQLDVLQQIVLGLPNRRIALELDISENTVKQHARAIFHTLGVTSRTEALIAAVRRGMKIGLS